MIRIDAVHGLLMDLVEIIKLGCDSNQDIMLGAAMVRYSRDMSDGKTGDEEKKLPGIPDGWERVTSREVIEGDKYWDGVEYFECKNRYTSTYTFVIRKTIPEISLPPGWKYACGASTLTHNEYHLDDTGAWKSFSGNHSCIGGDVKAATRYFKHIIRQVIDIDLSKQPVEFVAFTQNWRQIDNNKDMRGWVAHEVTPIPLEGGHKLQGETRNMKLSEFPKTWCGSCSDSLLVRPEHYKGITNG